MADKKKVLILYASAGHGHQKAAEAIEQALREYPNDCEVLIKDTLTLTRGSFGESYKKSYIFMIQHLSWFWGFLYYASDIKLINYLLWPFRRLVNAYETQGLVKYVIQESPNVIVSAHFMATEVVGHLKKKGLVLAPLFTVVTDYIAHFFWLSDGVDRYLVGASETMEDLQKRGVATNKISVTGIPIEKKFNQAPSRAHVRQKMNIPEERFTVLVTSGGAGVGALEWLVQEIMKSEQKIEILVVCGTNRILFTRIKEIEKTNPGVHCFAFVNNIEELMIASDLVVGKGGGLTVSESLSLGRPLLLFGSVPGQETRNAHWLSGRGAAQTASSLSEVARLIKQLAVSPETMEKFSKAALDAGRPQAANDIAKMVLSSNVSK